MENSIQIHGFRYQSMAHCEALGLSKCFEAYANHCPQSEIMSIGFNSNSGYTYIALEFEPISICSMLGREVEYLVTDFENGDEHFFESYEEAVAFDNQVTH
jgi:anthranilate/para-aminobenzoate synthase component II